MAAITSIVSLNQLVRWFEAFADNHFFLKDFGFGEPYDIGTTRQMEFPYMWLTLDDTSVIATGTNVKSAIPDYSFRVFFMDKINIQENYLDQNGFQSDNSQEIISDTIQYLQDLITYIQQNWGQYGVLMSTDVTFSPVIDETQDKSTGVSASITLRTRQVNCVIPEAPTNIIVQPNQPVYETLLTCETLEDCSTFQTYAYTGGTFTGSTLTLKSLNGNTLSVTGFTGGGGTSGTSGSSGVSGTSGVSFIWKGIWDGNLAYYVNEVVEYSGSSYICIQSLPFDFTPPPANTDYWDLLAQAGTSGANGTSGSSGINGTSGSSGVSPTIVGSTNTTNGNITVDAATTNWVNWVASFNNDYTISISNLTSGREMVIAIRNTNANIRNITWQASTTTTGYAAFRASTFYYDSGDDEYYGRGLNNVDLNATNGFITLTVRNIDGTILGSLS